MSVTFDTSPLFSNARWNGWTKLKPQSEVSKGNILDKAENKPGLYRIRHSEFSRLVYIGESAEVRRRMSTLANKIDQDVMPYRDPHTAAMSLWSYKNEYGGDFEVSWIEPEYADRKRWRKGMEAGLLSIYRLKENKSTISNYGRIHPGYTKSKRRCTQTRGKKSSDSSINKDNARVHPRSSWYNYTNPLSKKWMGYHWSKKYNLKNRGSVSCPPYVVYRLTKKGNDEILYIGETSDLQGRIEKHYQNYGPETSIEFFSTEFLDAKSRRLEVETDLIGAYYLLYGRPPSEQFTDEYRPPKSDSHNSNDQTGMSDYV